MRLKLRVLSRPAGSQIADVEVTVDDTATVAELVDALTAAEPACALAAGGRTRLDPMLVIEADTSRARAATGEMLLVSTGLRSGHAVALAAPGSIRPCAVAADALTVTIVAGPDAPAEFRLTPGRHLIGRSDGAPIVLRDPKVSARHAWLIAEGAGRGQVELIDNGSANGTRINGVAVDRGVVTRRERCLLGDSTLVVTPAPEQPAVERGGVVLFNRSPRLEPTFVGPKLVAPPVPHPPERAPFPLITTLAPILMIVVFVMITGGVGSIIFFLLMPLLSIAAWWEQRRHDRKRWLADKEHFHQAVARFGDVLDAARRDEVDMRDREQPCPEVVMEAARAGLALLWTRRPEHERFGVVRIGLADDTSRLRIEADVGSDANVDAGRLGQLLRETIDDRVYLTDVPLSVDLDQVGNLGVAGWPGSVDGMVRALVVHLATLYSPVEWRLVVLDDRRRRWMHWLPHCDPFDELATPSVAGSGGDDALGAAYVQGLVDLVAQRRQRLGDQFNEDPTATLPRIVVFVDDELALDRAALIALAEVGPSVGVHLFWTAPSVDRLPAACRAFIDLHAGGSAEADSERVRFRQARLGLVDDGRPAEDPSVVSVDFAADVVGAEAAEWVARWLSPLVDASAVDEQTAHLPKRLSLLDSVGHAAADRPDAVLERWTTVDRVLAGLRCVIGSDGASMRSLDLRVDGPHALVAGTTGAGKSEFLQTWIAAMALAHPPEHFTVLLVDYKGGSAFADCQHLPHCVGLVTDLTPHLVARALASLRAELRRRERLFERLGVSDLAACEVQFPAECPPSLVIVVDEFAALVSEVPDFVSGVVDVAQRGRSLGLHLVLATQRPAGVITDQVRANTNLRVALRMADTDDSVDVIGTKEAAHFDPRCPGRAAVRLGSAVPWSIQVAYVGGVTTESRRRDPIEVEPWASAGSSGTAKDDSAHESGAIAVVESNSVSDLTRLVATIRSAAIDRVAPRRPWLPELAERYRLEALPTPRTDLQLVVGVADRPADQIQTALMFEPERDGHLVVLGGGKSGKSTTLRTIAAAAGWATVHGGPVHVYALQFGGRSLDALVPLPHVGAVVNGTDVEHVSRVIAYLRALVDERQHAFAMASSSSLSDYRLQSGRAAEPRVVVLVDGVGRFRDDFESGRLHLVYEQFISLVADGPAVGVHLVVTASRPPELGPVITSLVHRRFVLRLSDDGDIAAVGAPANIFGESTPPGRGWCDGDEFQIAILGGEPALAIETGTFGELATLVDRRGDRSIRRLDPAPVNVQRWQLEPPGSPRGIALGFDLLGGETVAIEPIGVLLVTGVRGSGVSTTVAELVRELAQRHQASTVLFGSAHSALADVTDVPWASVVLGADDIVAAATALTESLRASTRPKSVVDGESPLAVLVIERIDIHLHEPADEALVALLAAARQAGVFVIATADADNVSGSWPLFQAVRRDRRGVMLRADPTEVSDVFGVTGPRLFGNVPPGRGIFIENDRAVTIQVALGVSGDGDERP